MQESQKKKKQDKQTNKQKHEQKIATYKLQTLFLALVQVENTLAQKPPRKMNSQNRQFFVPFLHFLPIFFKTFLTGISCFLSWFMYATGC